MSRHQAQYLHIDSMKGSAVLVLHWMLWARFTGNHSACSSEFTQQWERTYV